jgi:ubiquitin C-terminal hydrolase
VCVVLASIERKGHACVRLCMCLLVFVRLATCAYEEYSQLCPQHAEYNLYGVLVHQGGSCHSGHYYAFVKAPNDVWHLCDDDSVSV